MVYNLSNSEWERTQMLPSWLNSCAYSLYCDNVKVLIFSWPEAVLNSIASYVSKHIPKCIKELADHVLSFKYLSTIGALTVDESVVLIFP